MQLVSNRLLTNSSFFTSSRFFFPLDLEDIKLIKNVYSFKILLLKLTSQMDFLPYLLKVIYLFLGQFYVTENWANGTQFHISHLSQTQFPYYYILGQVNENLWTGFLVLWTMQIIYTVYRTKSQGKVGSFKSWMRPGKNRSGLQCTPGAGLSRYVIILSKRKQNHIDCLGLEAHWKTGRAKVQ